MKSEHQFCRFADIKNGRIVLKTEGLTCLEEFDYVTMVTVEGMLAVNNIFIDYQSHRPLPENENEIWISKQPIYFPKLKKYLVLLKICSVENGPIEIAHAFCSLLSNLIIVFNYKQQKLTYLKNAVHAFETADSMSGRVGGIAGVIESSTNNFPKNDNDSFSMELKDQGIEVNQMFQYYPVVAGYETPIISNMDRLIQSLILIGDNLNFNTELMNGPILKEYALNLTKQIDKYGIMNPEIAEEDIEVDDQFEEYLLGLEKYNMKCQSKLSSQSQTDIEEKLKSIREDVENEEPYMKDPKYARKMNKYMDRKESQILQLNDELQSSKNLNILQAESGALLQTVRSKRNNISKQEVDKGLNQLIDKYNAKASGSDKGKLLNEFLQVFSPTLYQQAGLSNDMDNRLKKLSIQNKDLEDQIQKMQKKKGCCSIM